ncbi:lysylphosphatidylglycerol synthase transmembrane domain-containing protein [Thermolongibacillus altinsuensis]
MTWIVRTISLLLIAVFVYLTIRHFEEKIIWEAIRQLIIHPWRMVYIFFVYALSFLLRAFAWKWYMPNVRLQTCLDGLFASLFVNHLAPMKIGDLVRIGVCVKKEKHVPLDVVAHSVAIMRLFDMMVLFVFVAIGIYVYIGTFSVSLLFFPAIVIGFSLIVWAVWKRKPLFFQKHKQLFFEAFRSPFRVPMIIAIVGSWICEAVILFEVAKIFSFPLSFGQAVWVNSMAVAGQIFQVTPGGLATYEAVMTFALTRLHPAWQEAYTMALLTHALKFIFSYFVGIYVLWRVPEMFSFVRKAQKKGWSKK